MSVSTVANDVRMKQDVLVDGDVLSIAPGALQVDTANAYHFTFGFTQLKYGICLDGSDDYQITTIHETSGQGITARLDLTADNRPMIAWFDHGESRLYFTEKVNNQWTHEVITFIDQDLLYFDFAIDSQDQPCLVYLIEEQDALMFRRRIDSQWNTAVIDDQARYDYDDLSMALDSMDRPHVVACKWYDLIYYFPSGSIWENEIVSDTSDNEGADIIIDTEDKPHLIVQDQDDLLYLKKAVSGWESTIIDTIPEYTWYDWKTHIQCHIAMTDQGDIRIAYPMVDQFLESYYRIMSYDGITWSILATIPVESWLTIQSSFCLQAGDPNLMYYENNTGKIRHYQYGNGVEQNRTVDVENKPFTNHIFQVDSQEMGHIVWYSSSENAIYYLKETSSGWIQEPVLEGDPLHPDLVPQLALAVNDLDNPIIACGIPGSVINVFKNDGATWSVSHASQDVFSPEDLNITIDSTGLIHLVWRTDSVIYHSQGNFMDWMTNQIVTMEDPDNRLISSVELCPDMNGNIYLAYSYTEGDMGTYYDNYLYSTTMMLKVWNGQPTEIYSYYGMVEDKRRIVDLAIDHRGNVFYLFGYENYAGCGTSRFTYFGRLNGYPDTKLYSYGQTILGSLSIDDHGNPVVISQSMDTLKNGNFFASIGEYEPVYNYGWETRDIMTDRYGMVVDAALIQRNQAKICHESLGDLMVSTQLLDPVDLQLSMPSNVFYSGESCGLDLNILNSGRSRQGVHLWCVIEIAEQFFYWPSWGSEPDFQTMTIPEGETIIELFPDFIWPETGSWLQDGNAVYAALLNQSNTALLSGSSGVDIWSFLYGPHPYED